MVIADSSLCPIALYISVGNIAVLYWRFLIYFITENTCLWHRHTQLLVLKAHDSIAGSIWAKALLRAATWDEDKEGLRMIQLMKVRSKALLSSII